jgi:hypothetical protein
VEAAILTPILLLILLGLIESGNGLSVKHKATTLSREGANLASRGSSLDETLAVVMSNGAEIALSSRGGAIVSRVVVEDGEPIIRGQVAPEGFETPSRLGALNEVATPFEGLGLAEGQVVHAVEVLVGYQPVTPLAVLFPGAVTDLIYERAVF